MSNEIPEVIHTSWHKHIGGLFHIPSIETLKYIILPTIKFYPKQQDIFNVFKMPLDEIKVVILGQDPYPQPNQAIGYAFAVDKDTNKPKSLQIIEAELAKEYKVAVNLDRTLKPWIDQGVFLLNTALTVEYGIAGSHESQWRGFINGVIRIIASQQSPIWMLWGSKARSFEQAITEEDVFQSANEILRAPHPAAEAYSGGKAGFYDCMHFIKANELLIKRNKEPIKWL